MLFRKKKERREEWGDPPWLRKTKRALLSIGAFLISASLVLLVLGQALGLSLLLLILGFFAVALTIKNEDGGQGKS